MNTLEMAHIGWEASQAAQVLKNLPVNVGGLTESLCCTAEISTAL